MYIEQMVAVEGVQWQSGVEERLSLTGTWQASMCDRVSAITRWYTTVGGHSGTVAADSSWNLMLVGS